jgi:8-oxo-dGTP pyrophosphatase MutT (NUDIX family)
MVGAMALVGTQGDPVLEHVSASYRGLPAGSSRPRHPEVGLAREVFEETGLRVSVEVAGRGRATSSSTCSTALCSANYAQRRDVGGRWVAAASCPSRAADQALLLHARPPPLRA